MNIPLLSKIFGKKSTYLQHIDSPLVSQLKKFADANDYLLFESTPVFHRSKRVEIPLLLFIPYTGLVLFEHKEWRYEELRDTKISKASHTEASDNSLAFDNVTDFIKEKFIDLSGLDDIVIFNFLILEQLRQDEFDMLDETFHKLMPKERILFRDSTDETISKKLKALHTKKETYTLHNTLPYIFSQYMILDAQKRHFANKEQRKLIDKKLEKFENIVAKRQSGKSICLLQKALVEKLCHPQKKITLITPTYLQAEILKHTLLELVEYSSVIVDLNEISICTPKEFLDEHKQSDLLFVDDAFLMDDTFISHLKQLQKEKTLLLINSTRDKVTFSLNQTYGGSVEFVQAKEFPTLMKSLTEVLRKDVTGDILIFTTEQNLEAMQEDIESFTAEKLSFVNIQESLRAQTEARIKLCNYDIHIPLHASYTFMIQPCQSDYSALEYLVQSSKIKSFIIYEDECDTIQKLKNSLEQNNAENTQK